MYRRPYLWATKALKYYSWSCENIIIEILQFSNKFHICLLKLVFPTLVLAMSLVVQCSTKLMQDMNYMKQGFQ